MTVPHLLFGRMLEFNLLPSRTLHHSHYAAFESPELVRAVQAQAGWRAAWHRQWSSHILRTLNIGIVLHTRYPELALGLLSPQALSRLARRVGVVLSGQSVRQTILGEKVRALQAALGVDLMNFARREGRRYELDLPQWEIVEHGAGSLHELETLGYRTLLESVSQAPSEVVRRVELKLPLGIQDSDSPLSAAPAWRLCLAVLKDMDSAWCSFFPARC